jgi:hypothetical protein
MPCVSSNADTQRPVKPSKKTIRRGSNSSKSSEDLNRLIVNQSFDTNRNSTALLSGYNYNDHIDEN